MCDSNVSGYITLRAPPNNRSHNAKNRARRSQFAKYFPRKIALSKAFSRRH